jgi:hypothetical protein
MKLVASALVAASALVTIVTASEQVWTSHPNYQACATVGLAELCTEKFYTVSDFIVSGEEVADTCADQGAFPWCPESEEESIEVYANLAVLEYTNDQGNLDITRWALEGISKWTGVEIDPAFNGFTKVISNYVCPNPLQTSGGVLTFFWNKDNLDESIFNNEVVRDQERRCVAMGEQMQFKWGNLHCGANVESQVVQKRRAVCVTTDDMSMMPGYTMMDMNAPENIRQELRQIINALRNAAIIFALFTTFIFTGCCFCCCFCCCCKPCRGGDSAPVVTQTVTQQQAAPQPQQFAPAPAPAPMMPQYAPPMQQPAYNPYQQPMMQPQQPMGGINLNISNNNTNSNK